MGDIAVMRHFKTRDLQSILYSHTSDTYCGVTESNLINTDVLEINDALRGGFYPGLISEIVGGAGSGKTQFVLNLISKTLCKAASNRSTIGDYGIAFIQIGGPFPSLRLKEMLYLHIVEGISLGHIPNCECPDTDPQKRDGLCGCFDELVNALMSLVFVLQVSTVEDFMDTIQNKLPQIKLKLRLVVIDCMANLFRQPQAAESIQSFRWNLDTLGRRAEQLMRVSAVLRRLAYEHQGCAVLVTNQVTAPVDGAFYNRPTLPNGERLEMDASLGSTWYQCVNVRCIIQKSKARDGRREFWVEKSPHCSAGDGSQASFWITQNGIVGEGLNGSIVTKRDHSSEDPQEIEMIPERASKKPRSL